MTNYGNSAFWLDVDDDVDSIISSGLTEMQKKTKDLYKLSAYRRAIGNFVSIVCNDNIPVSFSTAGDSFTDGKRVTIGSKLDKPKEFDVAVGLALHEGSHIKLSNFELLRTLGKHVPDYIKDGAIKKGITNPLSVIKNLLNAIEDRRIDYHIYTTSPGYRDYYHAMYDKYFNDPLIDKALVSSDYRDETIDSYLFRIVNIHNKNTDIDALKGLREIFRIIDLSNIGRLKNSIDALAVAIDVFKVILKNVVVSDDIDADDQQQSGGGQSGDGDEGNQNESGGGQSGDGDEGNQNESGSNADGGDSNIGDMDGDESSGSPSSQGSEPLTDKELDRLIKKIEKQRKFMNGDITKKKISKKDIKTLQAIESSGSELKTVGLDCYDYHGRKIGGVECVVVKKLTDELFRSDLFPYTENAPYWSKNAGEVINYYEREVRNGIQIGTVLGKKLKVRSEDRSTVFNRQRHGRIDKRMIAKLGFGDESVFQFTEIDKYKKANLHVSIDASYSMSGEPWAKTLTNTVALCKAIDMIPNLDIQVSIRSTDVTDTKPYIVLAYDSRVDKFSKVKRMFPGFRPRGYTPEGLTFEAVLNEFVPNDNDMDSYFLNLSDGEPYMPTSQKYGGSEALKYTKTIVDKIKMRGIKVLSYFIGNGMTEPPKAFKHMYGASARAIDVTNIGQIVKTMNELFMAKS